MAKLFHFQRLSTKVLLVMLIVSVIPIGFMALISYRIFAQSLKSSAQKRVVSVLDKKVTQVNDYIDERLLDIRLISNRPRVLRAMKILKKAYRQGVQSPQYRLLSKPYMIEFQEYLETAGYYDFFLIGLDGEIIFTVKHESDFGTNLKTGPHRNTGLAQLYREVTAGAGSKISSFDYYTPSQEQAAFIGAPLLDGNKPVGVVALQIDIREFLTVMGDTSGLENGGEILLGMIVGGVLRYVDPADFDPQSDILHEGGLTIKKEDLVEPEFAIWQAASGGSGQGILTGLGGEQEVSAWKYLEPLQFGMAVQIPVDIALASIETLKKSTFWIAFGAFVSVALIGRFFSRRVTRPIEALTEATAQIARGNLNQRVEVHGEGEIAQLADSFNDMVFQLRTTVNELRDVNESLLSREQELKNAKSTLEQRVKERTSEVTQAKEKLQSILDNTTSVIYIKDLKGRYTMVNRQYLEIFDLSSEEVIGHTDREIFPEEIAAQFQENDILALQSKEPLEFEEKAPHSGEVHHYLSVKFSLFEEQRGGVEKPYGICGISTDITDIKRNEEKLKLAGSVFDNVKEAIVITDKDNRIVDINPYYTILTGYTKEDVRGKSPSMAKSGRHDRAFYEAMWASINTKGTWSGEIWDRRKNGEIYPQWLNISAVLGDDGKVSNYVGIFSDISEQKATQKKLQDMAYYDPLTSLPNRHLFRDRLVGEIHRTHRNGGRCAVLFIDLDRFKYINDAMGHAAGDELLVQVADRLQKGLRETDTVSRLGGDEFTVILSNIESEEQAGHVAHNIIDALEKSFYIKEQDIFISGSIGISIYPDDGDNFDELTKNADTAMYRAKESGRGNYKFFAPEMNFRSLERIELEKEIRIALEQGEFSLHYQPKVNIKTGLLVGYEALIRWYHPRKEVMISPADFIPLAEENKLIIPIGEWVIFQAACDFSTLSRQRNLRISVNLSATQFHDPKIVDRVHAVLEKTGAVPESLELEITESAVMDDPYEAIRILTQIKEMGIHIAIDDFGTGYSSLSYLKKFPINTLKIDQSFIRDIPHDAEDIAIVKGIISLAGSLGLEIVAEGVETQAQAKFLMENGCEVAQGYLFGKPLSLKDLSKAHAV